MERSNLNKIYLKILNKVTITSDPRDDGQIKYIGFDVSSICLNCFENHNEKINLTSSISKVNKRNLFKKKKKSIRETVTYNIV